MLRIFVVALLIPAALSTSKPFNYSCALKEPYRDSTFPSVSLGNQTLTLLTTNRVSHQIVTRIYLIFLSEIIGFKELEIYTLLQSRFGGKYGEYATINAVVVDENGTSMGPAIDLEVWVSPDFHMSFSEYATEAGSLSRDLMRYGLFIPDSFGSKAYSYKDFIKEDPYYPRYYETIQQFKLDKELKLTFERIMELNLEVINTENVTNGFYQPQQCNSTSEPCVSVITSHYQDMKFFIAHVKSLKLKMNVYFLGKKLPEAIRQLNVFNDMKSQARKPVIKYLVLHWMPSEIINGTMKNNGSKIKFQPIEMPKCELYKTNDFTTRCQYDIMSVSIFYNKLVKDSDDLLDITRRIHFTSLVPIFDIYSNRINELYLSQKLANLSASEDIEDYYNQIACQWLQENEDVYTVGSQNSWLPMSHGGRKISIGGIFPPSSTGIEYEGIERAIEMATNMVRNDPSIIPGYEIVVSHYPIECRPDLVLKTFIHYYAGRKDLIGILGPSCSEAIEPISHISKHFKMNVISYSAEGISFDDRNQFPYFFRTIGETKQFEDVYAALFTEFKWKRLAALTEDGMKYTKYITDMEKMLLEKKIIDASIINKKFTRESNNEKQLAQFKSYLKELRDENHAKIIIADVHDVILTTLIMCAASQLQMTASTGYVWFLPVYISSKVNETRSINISDLCTETQIQNALKGHFALSYSSFGNDTEMVAGNQTIEQWKDKYLEGSGKNKTQLLDYAGFTFDAIWVYVIVLQELIKRETKEHRYMRTLDSDDTNDMIAEIIHGMNFQGVSGRIQFSRGGSRFADVNILQWQENDFALVGTYKPKILNRTATDGELSLFKFQWLSGERPTDGHESCTLEAIADFFGTDCHTISTVLICFTCILVVLACSGSSFLFWKRKYDKKIEESTQMMKNYGVVINGDLKKWEIQRENVVINRKLGEGCFGTVYGGEALVKESVGWEAVAIKTLKAGSNAENRLDFLAESETMKRFDHKNIVKLLAVCLQSEPLYSIMEFMLYGDLKTFLLARRHLVNNNDKINEDSDVSSKRLTLMALDVARGLSYLASMNYIHRDIACRNCMINAQRIVKLGDFGMARPTFENEYYRFARKGFLPVRWLAPESISEGLFSHGSDIWSYGVLLFEIVTLGAFPFLGMTNNQVFEHVKSGNSIKIPTTAKQHLKVLMSSCFSLEVKKRPGASTIVEYISKFPRMLTPCMDVPKPCLEDQVNLIDGENEQLERLEQLVDNRDRSRTPATVDFLRTSVSSSALQNHTNHHLPQRQDPSSFEYLDMKLPRRPNGIYLNEFHPDLTATLPNGNYNPVEPLLQGRPEISKSNLSLMKYMPMCGFGSKNSNRSSPDECTSAL